MKFTGTWMELEKYYNKWITQTQKERLYMLCLSFMDPRSEFSCLWVKFGMFVGVKQSKVRNYKRHMKYHYIAY